MSRHDGRSLPFPPVPTASKAGYTLVESTHHRRALSTHLPDNAPNVLIILLEDVGFGLGASIPRSNPPGPWVARTVPVAFTASETFGVGVDLGSPVSPDYFDRRPFRFDGEIHRVDVSVS
jgi:hypothetical protein